MGADLVRKPDKSRIGEIDVAVGVFSQCKLELGIRGNWSLEYADGALPDPSQEPQLRRGSKKEARFHDDRRDCDERVPVFAQIGPACGVIRI